MKKIDAHYEKTDDSTVDTSTATNDATTDCAKRCPSTGKLRYATRRAASETLALFRNPRWRRKNKDIPKRAYWCAECQSWHLTRLPARTDEKRRRRRT